MGGAEGEIIARVVKDSLTAEAAKTAPRTTTATAQHALPINPAPAPFQDLEAGRYRVIVIDPPWRFKNYSARGEGRNPKRHYNTMSLSDICAWPVAALAAKDCHLFLWTTAPHLEQSFEVMRAWGFKYSSTAFVWAKVWSRDRDALLLSDDSFVMGLGGTTRKSTELCLLGRRGSPKRKDRGVRELIVAARREHSRKPEESYRLIERYADGPRLDLCSRTPRSGWDTWGNEVDKFEGAAA